LVIRDHRVSVIARSAARARSRGGFDDEGRLTMTSADRRPPTVVDIPWTSWPVGVTAAVVVAADALAAAQEGDQITLVVSAPPADWSEREALREALRSLIHASVMEQPGIRANMVFGGLQADRDETVAYVNDATFVYGATVDLGVAS
jgi:hypothetical protein